MKTIKDFKNIDNAEHIKFQHEIKNIEKVEQETIINIPRDSSDQVMITRLSKLTSFNVAKYYTSPDSNNVLHIIGIIPIGRISLLNTSSRVNSTTKTV
jgi:cell division ATPase FtsA